MSLRPRAGAALLLTLVVAMAVADATPPEGPLRLDSQHLPNLVQLHPQVISGGLPADDAAFAELKTLGVKTIISVDGARPDVAAARRHHLRYVHLPHGYDGVPERRVLELAKAVRDLEGPIYIHCHHGKHRSPAAAGVACITAGIVPADQARSLLQIAGTSPHYRGLYASVQQASRADAATLDQLQVEFRETVPVPPMAEAMVELERTHDRLKQIAAANWQVPRDHPDLDPAHEALLLREHFTELLRTPDASRRPDEFQHLLKASETDARSLEGVLLRDEATSGSVDVNTAGKLLNRITDNCQACHQRYRDVPLGEK